MYVAGERWGATAYIRKDQCRSSRTHAVGDPALRQRTSGAGHVHRQIRMHTHRNVAMKTRRSEKNMLEIVASITASLANGMKSAFK